ncbi:MAG: RNA polymerase sigma factor [Bacteroidetes bacterium]|nr:RNA polymerase sigma factor [Bacteroidota bacterium]
MTQLEFNYHVKEQYEPLRGYAFKLTRAIEDAEDLVQETMLKAFNNKDKFAPGTNLKGWLYTILKNLFINNYRRKVKYLIVHDDTERQYLLDNLNSADKNKGIGRIAMQEIDRAMGTLPENLRIPFMKSFEGFKYSEIADELQVPLGTVKIRIHVARKKLQEALDCYGVDYGIK